jgi:hypothetical protein
MKIDHILIGCIGVDSGQIIMGDPWTMKKHYGDDGSDYSDATTASQAGGGVVGKFPHIDNTGMAVVSPTAYGDGIYPVFQVVEDGKLVGLFIDLEP